MGYVDEIMACNTCRAEGEGNEESYTFRSDDPDQACFEEDNYLCVDPSALTTRCKKLNCK